jgi:hypothetical protein
MVFAGIMLGDDDMASPTKTYPNVRFGQDMQTMYDDCWTGAKAVYAGHDGVWNGQPVHSHPSHQPYEHLHPRDWAPEPSGSGYLSTGNYVGEDYRRCCTSIAWIGQALAGRIMQAEEYYDHPAFFDYCDRWMTENDLPFVMEIREATGKNYLVNYMLQRQAWDSFVNAMWATYRDNLPQPVKVMPPKEINKSKIPAVNISPPPMQGRIEIRLHRSKGTLVEILTNTGILVKQWGICKGTKMATWDGKDVQGRAVEPGVYYAKLGNQFQPIIMVR